MARQVTRIIWHHSAGTTMSGAVAAMKAKGCHYHKLIDQQGNVETMREYDQIAYHAGANGNTGSIGICLIGNFLNTQPTMAQLNKARDLALEIEEIYGPVAFQNHRDVSATVCPVVDLATIIRDKVLTAQKDRDTQSPPPLTDEEKALLEHAITYGIVSGSAEDFDIAMFPALEMTVRAAHFIIDMLRGEMNNIAATIPPKKEKPDGNKNGKAEK